MTSSNPYSSCPRCTVTIWLWSRYARLRVWIAAFHTALGMSRFAVLVMSVAVQRSCLQTHSQFYGFEYFYRSEDKQALETGLIACNTVLVMER